MATSKTTQSRRSVFTTSKVNEAATYRIAGDLIDLAGKCFDVEDASLHDDGFTLIEMARYLVSDMLECMQGNVSKKPEAVLK